MQTILSPMVRFSHRTLQALVQLQDLVLLLFALGYVSVALPYRTGVTLLIPLQRPPTADDHLRAIPARVSQLSFPLSGRKQRLQDGLKGRREPGMQAFACDLTDHLSRRPAIQPLGACVPEGHPVV